jgi:phosphatidylglycerophosphate synthase
MVRYQEWRAVVLGPLLRLLSRLRITPDGLTLLSLVCGLVFCPLIAGWPVWAFVFLALHVILDALDGPLARHAGVASRAGSLTDTLCDQIVVAASTIVMMPQPVHVWAGATYIFVYTVVVAFAMLRNALGVPYGWLFRPRLIVYAWLVPEVFVFPGTTLAGSVNYGIWVFNAILAIKLLTGFWQVRERLRKPRRRRRRRREAT